MGQVSTMGRHQATIVHLWQDSDSFLKIICVKSVVQCNRFENEAEVMIHIRNVHYKDVRKMFASDSIEHLEADQEYHTYVAECNHLCQEG